MNKIVRYLLLIFIIFIVWMIHLETDASLGKIWIRPDTNGISRFRFHNLTTFFSIPLKESWIWRPSYLDTNPYFVLLFGIGLYHLMYWLSNQWNILYNKIN